MCVCGCLLIVVVHCVCVFVFDQPCMAPILTQAKIDASKKNDVEQITDVLEEDDLSEPDELQDLPADGTLASAAYAKLPVSKSLARNWVMAIISYGISTYISLSLSLYIYIYEDIYIWQCPIYRRISVHPGRKFGNDSGTKPGRPEFSRAESHHV